MTKPTGLPRKTQLRKTYAGEPLYPAAPLGEALMRWRDEIPKADVFADGDKGGRWTHLEELTGISARAIGRYATDGTHLVSQRNADKLCNAIGLHLDDVYPYEPHEAAAVWLRVLGQEEGKLSEAGRLAFFLLGQELAGLAA